MGPELLHAVVEVREVGAWIISERARMQAVINAVEGDDEARIQGQAELD